MSLNAMPRMRPPHDQMQPNPVLKERKLLTPTIHKIAATVCLACGMGTLAPIAIAAQILYDDFGAGDSFSLLNTYGADGLSGPGEFQAFRFVPTSSGVLGTIVVALGRTAASRTSTVFRLYSGPSTVALGTLLETFVVPNLVAPDNSFPFTGAPVTFSSSLMPTLTAGQGYWLSFADGAAPDGASSRPLSC